MDKLTSEQRKKNMQAVKNKGSIIEIMLAKKLWSLGLRYRKNYSKVFGKPDFVFISLKIAIFCDSEFWHGKDWNIKKYEIKSNQEFWYKKIEQNIKRDEAVNNELLKNGWIVLRFWGNEIKKNLDICANQIYKIYMDKKNECYNDSEKKENSNDQ
ncbi:MAG: Very short patch repair protein [Bacteroidetes bacterium ADurb.Bin028]|jgi:DNA mismatch endonuclease (patch repair protein)|nr:MAG: Very short patch repair protein [Bacteroidetes bacterium ADurb.Bin028]